jgi:hypothetical protein
MRLAGEPGHGNVAALNGVVADGVGGARVLLAGRRSVVATGASYPAGATGYIKCDEAVHDSFLQSVLSRNTVDEEEIDGELGRFDFEASGAPTPSPPINTSSTVSVYSLSPNRKQS